MGEGSSSPTWSCAESIGTDRVSCLALGLVPSPSYNLADRVRAPAKSQPCRLRCRAWPPALRLAPVRLALLGTQPAAQGGLQELQGLLVGMLLPPEVLEKPRGQKLGGLVQQLELRRLELDHRQQDGLRRGAVVQL